MTAERAHCRADRRGARFGDPRPRPRRHEAVRRPAGRQQGRLRHPPRLDRLADRPERRRQDDLLQHDHRLLHADRRRRSSSTATRWRGLRGNKVKSLQPHQVTALGIGRTFQNIRLFSTMSALDNVLVGLHVHLKSRWWDAILRTPEPAPRRARRRRAGARAPRPRRPAGAREHLGPQPAVRRPAAPGDRPRDGHEPEAAAPRRADRRHEQRRDPRPDRLHPPPARRSSG